MTPAAAQAVSDLCVRCGLCCSGALFDHGRLAPDEVETWQARGLTTTKVPAKTGDAVQDGFAMLCRYLAGTACSRYQLDRPAVCSSFFCKLAQAVADGSKDEATAHALVAEADAKLAALRPHLKADESWPAARARWRGLEALPTRDPADARFRVMMAALNIWLNRHFRKESGASTPMF